LIAVCTSVAAPSALRLKANCRMIEVLPSPLHDDMATRPGMAENCISSGVATEVAMVSGLAPGRLAPTEMVGKSASGRAATGSSV
jgi:hypothetical protein